LHCVAILQQAKTSSIGVEAPPHIYIDLYQAALALYIFTKFCRLRKDAMVPKDVDWAQSSMVGFGPSPVNSQRSSQAAEAWVIHGTEAFSGVRLSRILPELQQVLSRIGFTQLKAVRPFSVRAS
jgi:hypothetical protein